MGSEQRPNPDPHTESQGDAAGPDPPQRNVAVAPTAGGHVVPVVSRA